MTTCWSNYWTGTMYMIAIDGDGRVVVSQKCDELTPSVTRAALLGVYASAHEPLEPIPPHGRLVAVYLSSTAEGRDRVSSNVELWGVS